MGLTWDCVDIDEKSIAENNASVYIEKELMRVSKNALDKLDGRDVIKTFPAVFTSNNTVLILKKAQDKDKYTPCMAAKDRCRNACCMEKEPKRTQRVFGRRIP